MSTYLSPEFWEDKLPNLAAALREFEEKSFCLTKWGAVLKIVSIKDNLVLVCDPDAVDSGQHISLNDVKEFYNKRPAP